MVGLADELTTTGRLTRLRTDTTTLLMTINPIPVHSHTPSVCPSTSSPATAAQRGLMLVNMLNPPRM